MPHLLRLREAARRANVHPTTLRRAFDRGELDLVQAPSGLWFVSEAELARWLDKPRVHENRSGVPDQGSQP